MSHSCENYDTSNPVVLTIEGVYKHGENEALTVSQNVVFKDIQRDGSGNITSQDIIPIQRNHLYKVILTPKYDNGALVFDEIDYAIQVNDWQTGETLVFAGDEKLTAQSTPSFTVTGASSVSGGTGTNGTTNPTAIYTGKENHSVYLTVTSNTTGTMLESTTFPSTQYGLVSSSTTNDANGNLVEVYKIDIDENIQSAEEHTFTLSNAINTSLARTFVLKKIDPRLNPLWWMAQYNMKADGVMETAHSDAAGARIWNFTDAQTVTLSGYHMPSLAEMASVFPADNTTANSTRVSSLSDDRTNPTEYSEIARSVGGATVAASKSVMYRVNTGSDFYAIRFIGTKYASAWHYQFVSTPCKGYVLESYLIDDATTLSEAKTALLTIASSTVWKTFPSDNANLSPEDILSSNRYAYVQRFLPACGNGNSSSDTASNRGVGDYIYSWTSTTKPASSTGGPGFVLHINYTGNNCLMHLTPDMANTIRMFKNY